MHLRKIVNTFHKVYLEKLTVTSAPLDSALPMAKPTIYLSMKQKQGQLTRHPKNRAKYKDALADAPSKATKKKQQGGIRVSVVLEPEAGK